MFKSNKNKILLIINAIRYTRLVKCKVQCTSKRYKIAVLNSPIRIDLCVKHVDNFISFWDVLDFIKWLIDMTHGYDSCGTFGFRFQNSRRLLGNKNRIMIFSFLIFKIIIYNILFEINIFGRRGEVPNGHIPQK